MIIDHAHYQDGRRRDTGSSSRWIADPARRAAGPTAPVGAQIIQLDLGVRTGVRTVTKIIKRCGDSPERWARAVS